MHLLKVIGGNWPFADRCILCLDHLLLSTRLLLVFALFLFFLFFVQFHYYYLNFIRHYNGQTKKKKTKGQTTIYKTLHRKLKIEQKSITNDKVQKTPKEVPHNTCWCLVDHTLCAILGETRRMSSHSKKKRTIARKICSSSVLPFLNDPSVFSNACVIKQDK